MMKKLFLPLLLAFCFYSGSVFVYFLPPGSFGIDKVLTPHFLLVMLILMGIFYFRNRSLIYAAIFGLIFDIYFTEIIGIYFTLFPIAVYLSAKTSKFLQANILTTLVISTICLTLVEIIVYIFNVLIMQINLQPEDYVLVRLWPTLVLNLIFLLIIYYPFSRMLQKSVKEELNE
ncbi:rod shape-determining protein MreD [Lederbergia graminis]|uniref:Rod shape-determining protein MreD n=1 Tax=Lederbergia graminis TaxID=735518 RepID=A0ABW0LN68_9BACI|nr:rod shape-determining protein MreD [Paenibacillus bovis]HLU22022.1 rod shape-determining protein MreD [Bacillaceae bacterium]